MNDINKSTEEFEKWLKGHLSETGGLDPGALKLKHDKMRLSSFDFLRATFYRWAELWLAEENPGVSIAAVGDVHVENFGVWEAPEGKQGWQVNDFDEAATLPWTSDLVRLGVSAVFGLQAFPQLGEPGPDAHAAFLAGILAGYAAGLGLEANEGGTVSWKPGEIPKALEELRKKAKAKADKFLEKQKKKLEEAPDILDGAVASLARLLGNDLEVEHFKRKPTERKGTGSLGKRRFFAISTATDALGEAKAFAPSAVERIRPGHPGPGLKDMVESLKGLVEADYDKDGLWVVRRLTPAMVKSELDDLLELKNAGKIVAADVAQLFAGMGGALAKIHSLSPAAGDVRAELSAKSANANWYSALVKTWCEKTVADFERFDPNQLPIVPE